MGGRLVVCLLLKLLWPHVLMLSVRKPTQIWVSSTGQRLNQESDSSREGLPPKYLELPNKELSLISTRQRVKLLSIRQLQMLLSQRREVSMKVMTMKNLQLKRLKWRRKKQVKRKKRKKIKKLQLTLIQLQTQLSTQVLSRKVGRRKRKRRKRKITSSNSSIVLLVFRLEETIMKHFNIVLITRAMNK